MVGSVGEGKFCWIGRVTGTTLFFGLMNNPRENILAKSASTQNYKNRGEISDFSCLDPKTEEIEKWYWEKFWSKYF